MTTYSAFDPQDDRAPSRGNFSSWLVGVIFTILLIVLACIALLFIYNGRGPWAQHPVGGDYLATQVEGMKTLAGPVREVTCENTPDVKAGAIADCHGVVDGYGGVTVRVTFLDVQGHFQALALDSVQPSPAPSPSTTSPSNADQWAPPVVGDGGEEMYDADLDQPADAVQSATASQRAACTVPSDSYVDRVLTAEPISGAGASVDRAVAYGSGRVRFVALVTDVGFGTWVVVEGEGTYALDQGAADISGYPLTTMEQHQDLDPNNRGRGLLLACLRQGFPGDDRQAG